MLPDIKNKGLYKNFGDKGVQFCFESLRQIVTEYTKQELEERLERCIKNTFFDIGNKYKIIINNKEITQNFDIISMTQNPIIKIVLFHYKCGKEYITIFNEKDIGKKEDNYVTYDKKRKQISKLDLENNRQIKFCGKSIVIGSRIAIEDVEKEIEFWKGSNYYQDIKYNDLAGGVFIRNNISLNQDMERLPWDNNDYGDDQIRWKIMWYNNEDLDNIFGIQTIKIIQEDTKKGIFNTSFQPFF
jgi:hypothetical protein